MKRWKEYSTRKSARDENEGGQKQQRSKRNTKTESGCGDITPEMIINLNEKQPAPNMDEAKNQNGVSFWS